MHQKEANSGLSFIILLVSLQNMTECASVLIHDLLPSLLLLFDDLFQYLSRVWGYEG